VLTTRGGDFALHIGQDVSIGYDSHTDSADVHVPPAHQRGRRRPGACRGTDLTRPVMGDHRD
jgi:Encapsulating protein for peroxidase